MAEREDHPKPEQQGGRADAPTPEGPGAFDEKEVFVAPPTRDEPYVEPPEPPAWPKVIGIISIVLGGLGLCCNTVGVAGSFAGGAFMQAAAGQMEGGLPPALTDPQPLIIASQVVAVIVAIFLIVAASMLIGRKPVARQLFLVYGVFGIIITTLGIYAAIEQQNAVQEWMKQNPDADFTQQTQSQPLGGALGMVVSIAFGAIFGYAWPLFCLIWFGLVKRRPEDMTGGVEDDVI